MTCVECGAEATFSWCSNPCALAAARKRGNVDCAICSFDTRTGRIGRHDTNEICAACRRRVENDGWIDARSEEPDSLIETRIEEALRFVEQQDRPLPPVTPLTRQVATLIVEGERIPYVYRDGRGRRRGVKYRFRAYTVRRLAKQLGCTRMTIQREIDAIER